MKTIPELKEDILEVAKGNRNHTTLNNIIPSLLETLEAAIRLDEAKNYNAKLDQYFKKSEALDEVKTNS